MHSKRQKIAQEFPFYSAIKLNKYLELIEFNILYYIIKTSDIYNFVNLIYHNCYNNVSHKSKY